MMGYTLIPLTDMISSRNYLLRFVETLQNESQKWLHQHSPSALYYKAKVIKRKPPFPLSLFYKEQLEICNFPVMTSTLNNKIYQGKKACKNENTHEDANKQSINEGRKSV
jgi:hypothetical protein